MRTIETIEGTATIHSTNNVYLSWESPDGKECWAQGEFNIVDEQYVHYVFEGEDEAPAYKVVAS